MREGERTLNRERNDRDDGDESDRYRREAQRAVEGEAATEQPATGRSGRHGSSIDGVQSGRCASPEIARRNRRLERPHLGMDARVLVGDSAALGAAAQVLGKPGFICGFERHVDGFVGEHLRSLVDR